MGTVTEPRNRGNSGEDPSTQPFTADTAGNQSCKQCAPSNLRCAPSSLQCDGYLSLGLTKPLDLLCGAPGHHNTSHAEPAANPSMLGESPALATTPSNAAALCRFMYHILYHLSYREPVLYFQAHDQDGSPLSLETIMQSFGVGSDDGLHLKTAAGGASEAPVVTLEEHPVLCRPFFMLHPCQTGVIASLLEETWREGQPAGPGEHGSLIVGEEGSLRRLLSWLCVAGQPLGIAPHPSDWRALVESLETQQAKQR